MESIPLVTTTMQNQQRSCARCELIDYSEPLIITGILCSLTSLIYSAIVGTTISIVFTSIITVSSVVSEWRVRVLGVAKKLMDSVRDLRFENMRLQGQVEQLGADVERFEKIVGLVGDSVEDLEVAKKQLFDLYDRYKVENDRYVGNNLLNLFGLVDKDQNSKLDKEEIKRMQEYIRIVYKEEFDFNTLDKDNDGSVSLQEFFNKFKQSHTNTDIV